MASLAQINDFLGRKRLALIGVSRNEKDFSRLLFREFVRRGYDAVPVHPGAGEVDGRRCFAHLQDIQPPVEAALLLTSPAVTDQVVEDCAAAGIQRVWMYRAAGAGAVSRKAVAYCESRGMGVIAGECPLMFFPDASFFPHRLHGMVRKITGRYPR
jgi:predicted CoA-binding protein